MENTVAQANPLFHPCNQTNAKTSPGGLASFQGLRSHSQNSAYFQEGLESQAVAEHHLCPVSGGDHMQMKWWFSQLVEAGAEGETAPPSSLEQILAWDDSSSF